MQYVVDEKLGNEIVAYLSERPYKEVFMLLERILKLQPVVIQNNQLKGGDDNVQISQAQSQESNGSREETGGIQSDGEEPKTS